MSDSLRKALDEIIECEEKFINKIKDNPELIEAYEDLQRKNDKLLGEEVNATYSEGFSFGVLLGLDIVDKSAR